MALFHWQSTFYNALLRLRAALLRFAHAIRLLHVQRAFTNLTNVVDDKTRAQFSSLLTLSRDAVRARSQPPFYAPSTQPKLRTKAGGNAIREEGM